MPHSRGDNMLSNELLLLKIIDSNARLTMLREKGLSHSQVAMMISSQESEGNIVITDNEILLTEKGKELLANNLGEKANTNKNQWIVSRDYKFKDPLGFDKVILPKKKKI